ncbi:hypothetical protein J41TS12_05080 [Paenibacillus antibioticophila]|uniref:Alpha-glucosidase n=1 Tax=Paenibacillus antibioticophila TaxID=1274374 RepID=A0A919XS16_9BACL|nr:TIM-barrel domain-containing protein [Paenibacillus antibioticophila]GIO35647.1 hypothetical protein J41TS12_05080 [Paenibacillus antibioticophila]
MQTSESIHPDQLEQSTKEAFHGLGPVIYAEQKEHAVKIRGEHGNMAVRGAGPGIIRITYALHEDAAVLLPTPAVLPADSLALAGWELKEQGDSLELRSQGFIVIVDKRTMSVSVTDGHHSECGSYKMSRSGSRMQCRTAMPEDAAVYGLGETTGFLNKRGEKYTMWNSDIFDPHVPDTESLYQSIPVLIQHSKSGTFGVFIDEPGKLVVDMREDRDQVMLETFHGKMDLYILPGPGIKEVVAAYARLTGVMELPPLWSLGYQQSRFSYMNQEEVLGLAAAFREKRIPCDVIYLDIHYMDEYKIFTFDPVRFPNPKQMIAELKTMGFRIVPVVDPGVKIDAGYSVYEQGSAEGYFCRKPDGELFTGDVWPGASVFPDFTEETTRQWWGRLHQFYVEHGISGIWNDMNEPSVFNSPSKTLDPDVVHRNGGQEKPHEELHNLYGLLMCEATRNGLARLLDGERPFVLTRAGYAGIQRYAAVWTGDNRSYWEHMEMFMAMGMNLGLSGVAFCGADIGGFMHHTSGELLARWTQLGAFTPFFRNHSAIETRNQEPWHFGEEIEAICRKYIELRYRLLPYIYSLFRASTQDGLPIMSPLVLHHPLDQRVKNLSDQYLFGTHLLVAPICRPGREHRVVYLPEGVWFDYWTGERHAGGQNVVAYAPLDTLPLYVKSGAVLPMIPGSQHTGTAEWQSLNIHLYGLGAGTDCPGQEPITGEFTLYEDDGISDAYTRGISRSLQIFFEEGERCMSISCRYADNNRTLYSVQDEPLLFTIHHTRFIPTEIHGISQVPGLCDLEHRHSGWYYDKQDNHLYIKCIVTEEAGKDIYVKG